MDDRIAGVIDKVEAFIADKDDAWALPREAAAFVYAMVLACRSQHCVEIGTSYGYSGLWIGAAARANGGTLLTIDRESRKSEAAAASFDAAGLGGIITCRTGLAADILAGLPGPVDWVLNDADKENCRTYVELLYPRLPVGGVVLTDNAVSNEVVRDQFLPWIRADERFASRLIDVGNGIECSVKIR